MVGDACHWMFCAIPADRLFVVGEEAWPVCWAHGKQALEVLLKAFPGQPITTRGRNVDSGSL
jgi:hypothetical protein